MRKIDKYEDRYSRRTRVMRSSAMRDLMSLTARPEVISFAGGLAATDSFPQEVFARVSMHINATQRALSLQYGPTEGFDFLRADVAAVMAKEGCKVDPSSVLITTGAQQGIDLLAKTFVDPGDVVLAEGPAYAGALTTFSSYQAEVHHLPMDADGLVIEGLEAKLTRFKAQGRRAKFLYLVPSFSNPAGTTLSLERRVRLIKLARLWDLLIVEDNAYGLLRFEGEPLPTLLSLDRHENVVYLGSFSKIISPGLRTGWMVAPPAIYQKLVFAKQATDLCSSPLAQLFVHEFVVSGAWSDYLCELRGLYRSRRDALLEALSKEFPEGSTWTVPQGGFFVWATLPAFFDTKDLLVRALEDNVAFVPGEAFFMDGQGHSSLRLAFSANPEQRIKEGIRRLGEVIEAQLELYRALGFQ